MARIPASALGPSAQHMPIIGIGTVNHPVVPPRVMVLAFLNAMRIGYRHFDTAAIYQSEQPLGVAVAEALQEGVIKSRDELFITTKLWSTEAHRGLVVPALQNSLRNLGMEFVDLYLVHLPVSAKPGKHVLPINKEELMIFDMLAVWEEMVKCQSLGLTKAVGVSNFSCKKLEMLLEKASISPAVNQVEMNPLWQQKTLREFCAARGIHVSAYSPLGGSGTIFGSNQVMRSSILEEIAEAKGKTVAQVCLRWVYEQGVSFLVKSFDKERQKENLDIFDWELTEAEHQKILQIPQRKSLSFEEFCSDDGQYRTPEELWDGEI